jgi:organic hydroperoxide reductase OsmC/OhrA
MMASNRPRSYEYKTNTLWKEQYRGVLASDNRKDIQVTTPLEWGGHEGWWTPEHLFVSSIETCIMTTFLWWFKRLKGELVSYESEAVGICMVSNEGFLFTEVEIMPIIAVRTEEDVTKAQKAIDEASRGCIISRSLTCKTKVKPVIVLGEKHR